MPSLEEFVSDLEQLYSKVDKPFLSSGGQAVESPAVLIVHLDPLEQWLKTLTAAIGEDHVAAFFDGAQPEKMSVHSRLFDAFYRCLQISCSCTEDGHIIFDRDLMLNQLKEVKSCIDAGEMTFSIRMRIANIQIKDEFTLGTDIKFHNLRPEEIVAKYPFQEGSSQVARMVAQSWGAHCVEAIMERKGKAVDFQNWHRLENQGALENSIVQAFLVSGVSPKSTPDVTHFLIESSLESFLRYNGYRHFSFSPPMLTSEDIGQVQNAFNLIRDSTRDRVLETAIDRFVVGKGRHEHHPNRINQPNWDKIVDYVIAMETLLLTANGQPVDQELSYRFRLNGASLLLRCTNEKLEPLFHALKQLYALRSKVVHGGTDSTILKAANGFIAKLGIDKSTRQHSLGRMMLVCERVEEWLRKAILYLGTLEISDRPYRKDDGWEQLIWKSKHDVTGDSGLPIQTIATAMADD